MNLLRSRSFAGRYKHSCDGSTKYIMRESIFLSRKFTVKTVSRIIRRIRKSKVATDCGSDADFFNLSCVFVTVRIIIFYCQNVANPPISHPTFLSENKNTHLRELNRFFFFQTNVLRVGPNGAARPMHGDLTKPGNPRFFLFQFFFAVTFYIIQSIYRKSGRCAGRSCGRKTMSRRDKIRTSDDR